MDTAEGARAVEGIRDAVRSTYRPEVIGDIGGFGGLFSIAAAKNMADPVLVSGTDGVGTKLKLAQLLNRHDTVGIDLVAMCANDILVSGAEPLFFLDYVAIGKLDAETVARIVSGIAEGCRQAGCSLIGGEMAEHPGVMPADDYDLSGFCVGLVDRPDLIDGSAVAPGDVILGLASSGLHSNGFSLVRRVLVDGREDELGLPRLDLGGATLGDALLTPTRIYAKSVLQLLRLGRLGQGDGAHHRRRHHREPRPRAARRVRRRDRGRLMAGPARHRTRGRGSVTSRRRSASHVQHGHRVRHRALRGRRARGSGTPAWSRRARLRDR